MNPSLLISMFVAVGVAGSLFTSYHIGRTQGKTICEAEIYKAKLKQKNDELVNERSLTELQQQQISEAQDKLSKETELNAKLKSALDQAILVQPNGCITDGMLDAIKEYRATTGNKNSKPTF